MVAAANNHASVYQAGKTPHTGHSAASGNIRLLSRYVYFHIRYIRSNLDV